MAAGVTRKQAEAIRAHFIERVEPQPEPEPAASASGVAEEPAANEPEEEASEELAIEHAFES